MALFAMSFAVMLLAVAALAVGRLWNAPPLRGCRCDGDHAPHACVTCPLRDAHQPRREP